VRWRRKCEVEWSNADCGVRAGLLIEDDQLLQNGRSCHGNVLINVAGFDDVGDEA
jgi:hypothetical protein